MAAKKSLAFPNLLKVALHALLMVRPFVKMNAQQSAAWDIVTQLLGGNGTGV